MKDSPDFNSFQRDVDATSAADFAAFVAAGPEMDRAAREASFASAPALRLYDEAFERVLREVRETPPPASGTPPAVWFLYNMGIVVKTPHSLFAIDIAHRQGVRLAPLLDFALVTHNHDDHWLPDFYFAMDGAGKTVVSNFLDNYGAHRVGRMPGGFIRGEKVFELGDVRIRTALSDHNDYLADFTTVFEIAVGDWTLYHTGDSANLAKLNPSRQPDLWIVHPRCGLDIAEAAGKFRPRRAVIGHLCELGHTKWRWTVADGLADAAKAEAAGAKSAVPLWGQRIQ